MSGLRFFYALFLRVGGLGLVCVGAIGLLLPGFAEHEGTPLVGALPFEANAGAVLLGLYLLIPWWLPRGLRQPERGIHLIWAAPLAGASWLASTIFVSALRTLDPVFPTQRPLAPEIDMAWGAGAFVAILLVAILALAGSPAEPVRRSPVPSASETGAALSIHRAFLAFAGISIAMSAFITGRILLESPPATFGGISTGPLNVKIGLALLGVIAGLSLLVFRATPSAVRRPTRWLHFFAVGAWLAVLTMPLVAVFAIVGASVAISARELGFEPEIGMSLAQSVSKTLVSSIQSAAGSGMALILGGIAQLALIVTSIVVIKRPVEVSQEEEEALRPYSVSSEVQDMPDVPKKKDLRAAALPEPKLPAMGGIMKLYVAADWLVMRLLGLGLLGTGYLLWQMMEAGRELPQLALNYGFPSLHALIAYCTFGALLGIPFLLPRIIVAPRHVVGGLVKAALILGAGLVVRPVVPTAIALLTDEKYHATLLYVAPYALNAVVGLAVAAALFTSFFRQMGKAPKTDYLGNPMIEMTPADLHRLREARMGIN